MKIETEFNIGDIVHDDLTNTKVKIIGISFSSGYTKGNLLLNAANTIGYWIDNTYLSGGRFSWEISKI